LFDATIIIITMDFNNVGIFDPKEFKNITNDEWFKFFEVNVLSGVCL
jgi:hypothetical protein